MKNPINLYINEILCGGDDVKAAYVWAWIGKLFRDPYHGHDTALQLVGPKGSGKSTLATILESACTLDTKRVTGQVLESRFNMWLKTTQLLVINNDKMLSREQEQTLMGITTSRQLCYEAKGLHPFLGFNSNSVIIEGQSVIAPSIESFVLELKTLDNVKEIFRGIYGSSMTRLNHLHLEDFRKQLSRMQAL